jgi:hypothetical protein
MTLASSAGISMGFSLRMGDRKRFLGMLAEKVISVRTLTQIITPSTHSPQGMNEELKMFLCMHNPHTKTVGQKNQVVNFSIIAAI